jgi:hypothetical protein
VKKAVQVFSLDCDSRIFGHRNLDTDKPDQGEVMTKAVRARIFTVATMAFGMLAATAAPAFGACKMQLLAAVDVELADGTVLVPVKANGQEVWMILGMANGVPSAWREAAERLGLKLRTQDDAQLTVNGTRITQKTVVDSLLIGSANFAKWDFYILPAGGPPALIQGRPLLGNLTSNFMNVVDLELDLARKKINLFKQTTGCKGEQVYWGDEVTAVDMYRDASGLLVFPMEIDGKRVEASLNTQGRGSYISETVTKKFFGFDRDSSGISKETSASGNDIASYRAMSLTSKGLAMKNVKIRLRDDLKSRCDPSTRERNTRAIGFNGCFGLAPLSIGTDMLKRLRIYIATKENKIYFTRAAEPAPASGAAPDAADRPAPAAAGAAAVPSDVAASAADAGAAAPAQ